MQIEEVAALIRAYGLDESGKPGFFTQNLEVTDVTPELNNLYSHTGRCICIQQVVSNSSMLTRHWQGRMMVRYTLVPVCVCMYVCRLLRYRIRMDIDNSGLPGT
jgi:hypothetical protein